MLLDHCCGCNDGRAAMTAAYSRKTLQTLISAFWDPRTVCEVLWSRSLQFIDCRGMLDRKSKGFSRKSPHIKKVAWWVHAIMRWHSQCVGWSGYLDSFDCWLLQRSRLVYSNGGLKWTWIEVAFDLPKATSWLRIWGSEGSFPRHFCNVGVWQAVLHKSLKRILDL